jgi:hypothetical protein
MPEFFGEKLLCGLMACYPRVIEHRIQSAEAPDKSCNCFINLTAFNSLYGKEREDNRG